MATFADNLLTIDNGVYGEDIRQAIRENLDLDHASITELLFKIVELQSRVDALIDGGGGDEPGPSPGPTVIGGVVSGSAEVSIQASISIYMVSGEAIAV